MKRIMAAAIIAAGTHGYRAAADIHWEIGGSQVSIETAAKARGALDCSYAHSTTYPNSFPWKSLGLKMVARPNTNTYVGTVDPGEYPGEYVWPFCVTIDDQVTRTYGVYIAKTLRVYYPASIAIKDITVGETINVSIRPQLPMESRIRTAVRHATTNKVASARWWGDRDGEIRGTIIGQRHGVYQFELTVVVDSD